MSKVIHKYPIYDKQTIIKMPFPAQILSVNYDPTGDLYVWAVHDNDYPKGDFVKYEFLMIGTGELTDEPLNVLNDQPDRGYDYYTTLVSKAFVWHIFMRMRYWDEE